MIGSIMKRSQMILWLVVLVLLGRIFLGNLSHRGAQRRTLTAAVSHQIDGHSSKIAGLLVELRGRDVSQVEDAVWQELQARPSTTLISRSMIKVAPGADGSLECVIDSGAFGLPSRTIRGSLHDTL